jgi:hypothetical protein
MQVLTEDVLDAVYKRVAALRQHLDKKHLTGLLDVLAKNEDESTISQIKLHTSLDDQELLAELLKVVAQRLPGKQTAVTSRTGEAWHHA